MDTYSQSLLSFLHHIPTQGHFSGVTYHLGCLHLSCLDNVITMALRCDWESKDSTPAKSLLFWTFPAFVSHGRQNDEAVPNTFSYFLQYYFFSPTLTALFHSTAAVAKLSRTIPSLRNHSGKTGWRRQISASERMYQIAPWEEEETYKNDRVYLDSSVFLITTFTTRLNSRNFLSGIDT